MQTAASASGVVPPSDLIAAARARVNANGMSATARACEVSRQALAHLLAGLRVHRGTVALVAKGVGWSADESTSPLSCPPRPAA